MKLNVPKYVVNYIKNIKDIYNTEFSFKKINKKEYVFRKIKRYLENNYYFEEIINKIVFHDGIIKDVRIIRRDLYYGKIKVIKIENFNYIVLMDKIRENGNIKYRFKLIFS